MILVDIYVPSMNQTYDFSLNEYTEIALLVEEVSGMICQKEQCEILGNSRELLLLSRTQKKILNPQMTLSQYEISQGEQLMIV